MKPSQHTTSSPLKTTANDVVRWALELRQLHARLAPFFARPEPRQRSLLYLQGILSDVARKNGWQLAEQAGETRPDGMQRLLSHAVWDEEGVRDELRKYVLERLGDPHAIVAIDETSFPKRGDKSAGVAPQYCGSSKQVENCQVRVFLSYISPLGHTLLDRELYLPRHWLEDRPRCQEAGIPETVRFQTKCELARRMMERLHQAQVPIDWVVADTVYGNNLDLRTWLEDQGYSYVLAVANTEPIGIMTPEGPKLLTVKEAEQLLVSPQDWQRLSVRTGTKGPLFFDWACLPILHRWQDDNRHWLLIRRLPSDPSEKTDYLVFGPLGTTLEVMVRAIGARWCIEEEFENGKDIGLDHCAPRCTITASSGKRATHARCVRRRIEPNCRGKLPVGGNDHTAEAETTACVWCRYARGMKPVKVVAQVAYVLSRQDMAKVARAVSSPHGDERNPCLKLRQGPLSERVARKGVWC